MLSPVWVLRVIAVPTSTVEEFLSTSPTMFLVTVPRCIFCLDPLCCLMSQSRLHRHRQSSSQYLPVAPPSSPAASSRASSRDNSSRDNPKRAKDTKSRQNNEISNPKRRSTMNSRDAAYDEEEQLLRAIEESKEDTKTTAEELAKRRGKRSRSDSEAYVILLVPWSQSMPL